MTPQDKAARIQGILNEHYPEPPFPLDHSDAYTMVVAVALAAQTTDKKVNEVTPRLFARASTPAAMAALSVEEIRQLIDGVSLANRKAAAVKGMAEQLVANHGGTVPGSFEELEELPGVGHKTASMVMAQAFGVPAFAVDTHVHRLAGRWGLSEARNTTQTERDLKALFPRERWSTIYLQMIHFGRERCPAKRHDAGTCPICSWAAPG
ncbi:MAG: endonuclease III [Myxococcales bacterium]|nr:endonuclease III [Myxococcales bacterium]